MARLIGLNGYAGAGKDTVADILVRKYGFRRMAFADKLKAMAVRLYPELAGIDIDAAKRTSNSVRELLQNLGTVIRQDVYKDFWVDALLIDYDSAINTVITDVRFDNEEFYIKEFGGEIWRIEREGYGPVNGHVSEQYVPVRPSVIIRNNGTISDLKDIVDELMAEI